MADILCRVCGEPYDNYTVYHEMDEEDGPGSKVKFLSGSGCPACHWGTYCHHCNGTGIAGEWGNQHHGGYGYTLMLPNTPCRWCNGDPKHPKLPEDMQDEALRSLFDGTDEDPTIYLGV